MIGSLLPHLPTMLLQYQYQQAQYELLCLRVTPCLLPSVAFLYHPAEKSHFFTKGLKYTMHSHELVPYNLV